MTPPNVFRKDNMYANIEEAQQALQTAAMDVEGDMGEHAVEAGWHDIVHAIAASCDDDVAKELIRRNT